MASKKDKEFGQKEDDSKPRQRQYAFDDIAALNKGVTPAMATKDDFVLAYKTSSNKVQYICDKKDLLLPWAQILTARLKAAGRLGSILETETVPKVKSNVLSASMSDVTYLTEESIEESGLEISDAVPQKSAIDYNIDVLEKQKPQTTSILKKYETNITKQIYIPDESMSGLNERTSLLGESKFGMETASCSRGEVEGENSYSSITKNDEVRTFESNIEVCAANVDIKKIKFTMDDFPDSHTVVFAADELVAADKLEERSASERGSVMYGAEDIEEKAGEDLERADETPDTAPKERVKQIAPKHSTYDHSKTKGLVTDTKVIQWDKNELVDYRDLNHTGYFRDQKRRIDLIIVVDDTAHEDIENIKDAFFANCINAGLEFELEMGVAPKNSGLVYIKIHAPNAVIQQLGDHYSFRKYFKNNHLELSKDAVPDEKDIIKCIRRNYPGPGAYSTIDRIYIVYKFLRFMPFGDAENYRGIERLIERGIFREVYPLHDGPFYIMDQDYTSINGRQALHENWVGSENIIRRQPVNTIREYLGERMGFLFAFFEFYNLGLVAALVGGILVFLLGHYSKSQAIINASACTNNTYKFPHWFTETVWLTYRLTYSHRHWWSRPTSVHPLQNMTYECRHYWFKVAAKGQCPYNYQMSMVTVESTRWFGGVGGRGWWTIFNWFIPIAYYYQYQWTSTYSRAEWRIGRRSNYKITTYYDLPVCPKCKDFQVCPFINMTVYCLETKMKTAIDNPYGILALGFIVLWAILFSRYWQRKEYYLYWMWECRPDDMDITFRPDFVQEQKKMVIKYLIKAFVISFILLFYLLGIMPTMLLYLSKTGKQLAYYYKSHEGLIKGNYFNLGMVAALNAFLLVGIQGICIKVTFPLNRVCHNQRTEKYYERSLTFMMFGFTFLSNLGFVIYFQYIKGIMYSFPSDETRWYMPLGLGYTNCGMLTCIDETLLVFVITQTAKKCYVEFDQMFHYRPNDLSAGKWTNQNVPCWEKEMDLLPVNEADVMKKFNYIVFQFVLVTFYFWMFPFTALLAFAVNIYEIRYWSKLFILHSRRPLPIKTWGLGSWGTLMVILPYMGALFQITSLVRLSNVIARSMHNRYFSGTRYFMDFAMGMYNTSDFLNTTTSIDRYGNFVFGSPALEWYQYSLASFNKHLYPHWQKADFCLFPNMYNRRYQSHKLMRVFENSYMPNLNFWHHMWLKLLTVLAFEQFTVLSGIILGMLVDKCSERVRTTRDVEAMITTNQLKSEDMKKTK